MRSPTRTRALIPVHYAGRPADTAAFRLLAARHGAVLIEDAAHCVEGRSGRRKIGADGRPHLLQLLRHEEPDDGRGRDADDGARGLGIVRARRVAARHEPQRVGAIAKDGSPHYDVVMPGYKYNMMDLQAAIGLHQLASLEQRLQRREAIWRAVRRGARRPAGDAPGAVPPGDRHARHLYTLLVDPASGWTRDALAEALRHEGIATSVHFRRFTCSRTTRSVSASRPGMFPVAEMVSERTLSLPLSSGMTDEQVERVIAALRTLLRAR